MFIILNVVISAEVKDFEYHVSKCKGGDSAYCYIVGLWYDYGSEYDNVEQDKRKAISYYSRGCVGGSSRSCNNLGVMYFRGDGIRQNKDTAKELFGKACDYGFMDGCNNYKILNEKEEKNSYRN